MKPAPFAYTKARTLKEAVALLAKHKATRGCWPAGRA